MDSNDEIAIKETAGFKRSVRRPRRESTAIRNWNEAARLSRGKILVVVADDLWPAPRWDEDIIQCLKGLNPEKDVFALKVADFPAEKEFFMRHPIVSRALYSRLGLFSSQFSHLSADSDLSLRVFWNAVILDGRRIAFRHNHPSSGLDIPLSKSQLRGNRDSERSAGRKAMSSNWRPWQVALGVAGISSTVFRFIGKKQKIALCLALPRAFAFLIGRQYRRIKKMVKRFVRRRSSKLKKVVQLHLVRK